MEAIADEDPALGIPTTYYGAVQLIGTATVHDERDTSGSVAAILRDQLQNLQPDITVAEPSAAHPQKLLTILGISIVIDEVSAKFKYGGNVDEAHCLAVVDRLLAFANRVQAVASDIVSRPGHSVSRCISRDDRVLFARHQEEKDTPLSYQSMPRRHHASAVLCDDSRGGPRRWFGGR